MQAKDIMTREVVTVKLGTSVEEVVEILSQEPFSGLPVVDEEGNLKGMVSEYDLIIHKSPLNYPRFINILGGIIHLDDLSAFNEKLKKSLAVRVDEVMTSPPISVEGTKTLEELASIMVEKRVNRLPVVEEGRLVGMVTRADIVSAMANDGGEKS